MDALSSTEFRKRFARLTEPTKVTVNGHVIGDWRPVGTTLPDHTPIGVVTAVHENERGVRYDIRPIRPAPKPGR